MRKGFLAALLNAVLVRHVIRLFSRHAGQSSEHQGTADTSRPRVPLRLRSRAWLQACQHWWHGCARFWQHVMINLAIGLFIEAALVVLHHVDFPALVVMEDAAMDFIMRHYSNVSLKSETNAYVLLDIDQQTYEAWDEPFHIPREKLVALLEFARSGNPAVIIVDVDLGKSAGTQGDDRLIEFMRDYDKGPYTPLILVRTLKTSHVAESVAGPPVQRASFLDGAVSGHGNIFWASPHYKRDSDYRVRRWLLWQRTCRDEQADVLKPEVLVSVEMLVKALLAEKSGVTTRSDRVRADLEQCFSSVQFRCDTDVSEKSGHAGASCPIGRHVISLESSLTAQRLIYSIPYAVAEGENRPPVKVNGNDVELFRKLPALSITDGQHRIQAESLEGKIVVIGGSYRESRDWYATPLGEMPGVMVILNAVHSLDVNGQLKPPGLWLKFLIVSALIVIMSLLFARFNSFTGMVLASLAVILLLIPFSFFLFRSGVWVDFALPLFAVQVHQIASEFEESRAASKKRQESG